jgi:hypothetical protein
MVLQKHVKLVVHHLHYIGEFSCSVSAYGKARLAANGLSPLHEA